MSVFTLQPDRCPRFESPWPLLIPVGFEVAISFQGRNLDIYTGRRGSKFSIGTELMKSAEREVTQQQGSEFTFKGYKVSSGHPQYIVFLSGSEHRC